MLSEDRRARSGQVRQLVECEDEAFVCGLESGSVEFNKHLQCVVRAITTSGVRFRSELITALHWTAADKAAGRVPAGTHLKVKQLQGSGKNGKGHHTWLFMVGYVLKALGQPGCHDLQWRRA